MHGFPKRSKLLTKESFQSVFQARNIKKFDGFLIYYLQNDFNYPRIGMSVSKKNVKLATNRNRIKRIVRESFRCSDVAPMDYILVAKEKIQYHSGTDLRVKLDRAWEDLRDIFNK